MLKEQGNNQKLFSDKTTLYLQPIKRPDPSLKGVLQNGDKLIKGESIKGDTPLKAEPDKAFLDENRGIKEKDLRLEQALINTPKFYFLFDLHGKRIWLKARGMTLRGWEIEKISFIGDKLPVEPIHLLRKKTFMSPKREYIEPHSHDPNSPKKEEAFHISALECNDMPTVYTFFFDKGLVIYVSPHPKGFMVRARSVYHFLERTLVFPIRVLWCSVKKRPFTAITIILKDPIETQTLFWAGTTGTESLFGDP